MRYWAPALFILSGLGVAAAAELDDAEGKALYQNEIRPLLAKNCLGCHNPKLKQGGLDLSSREAVLRGGDNGPVVVVGNAQTSHLFKLVSHFAEPGMPFRAKKLSDE